MTFVVHPSPGVKLQPELPTWEKELRFPQLWLSKDNQDKEPSHHDSLVSENGDADGGKASKITNPHSPISPIEDKTGGSTWKD